VSTHFRKLPLILLVLAATSSGLNAQTLAVGGRAGTFGLGGEAILGLGGNLALRAGFGLIPGNPSATFSGIKYEIRPPSSLTSVGADLNVPGGLRLFGGILFGAKSTEFTGRLAQSARIGDQTYTPAQAGTLEGALKSKSAAPFLGLGFGRYGSASVGITLDLGVAFMGENDLELAATGPFRNDPTFQQELEKERASVEADLRKYTRLYPVLNLGLHVAVLR